MSYEDDVHFLVLIFMGLCWWLWRLWSFTCCYWVCSVWFSYSCVCI